MTDHKQMQNQRDRNKISGEQNYELAYSEQKPDASSQPVKKANQLPNEDLQEIDVMSPLEAQYPGWTVRYRTDKR